MMIVLGQVRKDRNTVERSTLYGATTDGVSGESRTAAFTRIDAAWHLSVIRYWRSSDAAPYTWPLDPALGGDLPAVVSFETAPGSITDGSSDTALVAMFTGMPTNRPIWWCYYHEPEDQISAGTFTVAQFKAAWSHVLDIAASHAPVNARSAFIIMGSTYLPASVGQFYGHPWDWYWPDDRVDVVGGDDYQFVSPHEASAAEILQPHIDAAATLGKPWALAEYGAHHSATDRDGFIVDSIDLIDRSGNCEFACYYESWRGARGPWNLIDVSPGASTAWGEACSRGV